MKKLGDIKTYTFYIPPLEDFYLKNESHCFDIIKKKYGLDSECKST